MCVVAALVALSGSFVASGATATGSTSTTLSGSWALLSMPADQPVGLSEAAVAFDPVQGLGLLFGGRDANGTLLNDTWVSDGDHPGQWAESEGLVASPPPLAHAGLTYDAVFGGFLLFGGRLASGMPYDGTWTFINFQWTEVPMAVANPPADPGPALAYFPTDHAAVLLSSAGETWTFASSVWTRLAPSVQPSGRTFATAVWDPDLGRVLLFGGSDEPTGGALNETWSFSGGTWTRLAVGTAPPPQAAATMSYDPRIPGVLLVMANGTASTWTYTTVGWSAWPSGPAPPARVGSVFYFDSTFGCDILLGGTSATGTIFAEAWGWSVPPALPDPTLGAAAVGTTTWIEIAAVAAVPILLALLLRLRPPRTKPADAPERVPAAAPG